MGSRSSYPQPEQPITTIRAGAALAESIRAVPVGCELLLGEGDTEEGKGASVSSGRRRAGGPCVFSPLSVIDEFIRLLPFFPSFLPPLLSPSPPFSSSRLHQVQPPSDSPPIPPETSKEAPCPTSFPFLASTCSSTLQAQPPSSPSCQSSSSPPRASPTSSSPNSTPRSKPSFALLLSSPRRTPASSPCAPRRSMHGTWTTRRPSWRAILGSERPRG